MNANGSFSDKIDDSGLIISVRQQNSNQILTLSYRWPALFLIFFSITGVVGNLLVCLAIGTERRLHTRINWFLFSLALADMLVSGVVIPLAIVKEFTGKNF
jgi:heme/copper-type cytochrome/quinol oxidase subunit 1